MQVPAILNYKEHKRFFARRRIASCKGNNLPSTSLKNRYK
jgi:hypothetical protein